MAWDNSHRTDDAAMSVNNLTDEQKRGCHVVVGQFITDDDEARDRVRAILGV